MSTFHPFPDDDGRPVRLLRPSMPTPLPHWRDPGAIATVVPGGATPACLNGIAVAPWAAAPTYGAGWGALAGGLALEEPPFAQPPGTAAAAGAVVLEDDGRVWLVAPSNAFGGYAATFPKGRADPGAGLACAAIRETFEESGLQVRIDAFLLDVRRTRTYTRYYLARRIGGDPAAMGWETQAVHLVPAARLREVAVHANDEAVIAALERYLASTNGIKTG